MHLLATVAACIPLLNRLLDRVVRCHICGFTLAAHDDDQANYCAYAMHGLERMAA